MLGWIQNLALGGDPKALVASTTTFGVVGNIEENFALSAVIDDTGQGEKGVIDDTGQGVEGTII